MGPSGAGTRPTSDKVKGALFSMLENLLAIERPGGSEEEGGDVWEGLVVLDLYAGTGALGIEALSRGAAWCDFVEANAAARRTIERNLQVTGLAERGRVLGLDVEKVVRGSGRPALRVPYDVVLLDPPYADPAVGAVLASLATGDFLVSAALVAAEHSRRVQLAERYDGDGRALIEVRQRRHGDTVLSIYRYGEKDEHGDEGDLSGEL